MGVHLLNLGKLRKRWLLVKLLLSLRGPLKIFQMMKLFYFAIYKTSLIIYTNVKLKVLLCEEEVDGARRTKFCILLQIREV